jgi:hypothetical protein
MTDYKERSEAIDQQQQGATSGQQQVPRQQQVMQQQVTQQVTQQHEVMRQQQAVPQQQVNINIYLLFSSLFYYACARAEKHNEIVSRSVLLSFCPSVRPLLYTVQCT